MDRKTGRRKAISGRKIIPRSLVRRRKKRSRDRKKEFIDHMQHRLIRERRRKQINMPH